jgi:divalent metal cation (Fe/Co/Zn/Cd) transporter
VFLSHQTGNAYLDGAASIVIGLILAAASLLLAYESKGLLVGESADLDTVRNIRKLVESDPVVERVQTPLTMHLGPNDVLLNLEIQFRSGISEKEIAAAINRLEEALRTRNPEIRRIFIEARHFRRTAERNDHVEMH